jgi:RimJ/RimL family protein N-acetyltransferase
VDAGPVLLRRLRASDAGAVAAAVSASLDQLRRWMPWATPEAADQHQQLARVAEAEKLWESGTDFVYSVVTTAHGTLVGEIALHPWLGDGHMELGYWIASSQARRGYGTAGAGALTSVALAMPGVCQVEIHCDAANYASSAIARKLGYRLERIKECTPETPGETGRLMIWVRRAEGTEHDRAFALAR